MGHEDSVTWRIPLTINEDKRYALYAEARHWLIGDVSRKQYKYLPRTYYYYDSLDNIFRRHIILRTRSDAAVDPASDETRLLFIECRVLINW